MIGTITALLVLQGANTLTPEETSAGWKLLFDGKSTAGWHNFKAKGVKPGWAVKDGALTVIDPDQAGDILTDEQFSWFELTLDYNLGKGQNSGIMFHVADSGDATWHTGPEIQLYDDQGVEGAEKSGWLYQLYKSPVDAAKPAGEWNKLRVVIAPTTSFTELNGVKYYEYVLGGRDWDDRVKKSKFSAYPDFGNLRKGSIAIQGDHGIVSFRNIKIKPLK